MPGVLRRGEVFKAFAGHSEVREITGRWKNHSSLTYRNVFHLRSAQEVVLEPAPGPVDE